MEMNYQSQMNGNQHGHQCQEGGGKMAVGEGVAVGGVIGRMSCGILDIRKKQ